MGVLGVRRGGVIGSPGSWRWHPFEWVGTHWCGGAGAAEIHVRLGFGRPRNVLQRTLKSKPAKCTAPAPPTLPLPFNSAAEPKPPTPHDPQPWAPGQGWSRSAPRQRCPAAGSPTPPAPPAARGGRGSEALPSVHSAELSVWRIGMAKDQGMGQRQPGPLGNKTQRNLKLGR